MSKSNAASHRAAVLKNTRKTLNSVSAKIAATAPATSQYAGLTASQKQVVSAITAQPNLSVPEYAGIIAGPKAGQKEIASAARCIRYTLAHTAAGKDLIEGGKVAVVATRRKPSWFRQMTAKQRAMVTQRTSGHQEVAFNAASPVANALAKIDVPGVADNVTALRSAIATVGSVGSRWKSQVSLKEVSVTDDLITQQVKDTTNLLTKLALADAMADKLIAKMQSNGL